VDPGLIEAPGLWPEGVVIKMKARRNRAFKVEKTFIRSF
jgi:hypothetical protein